MATDNGNRCFLPFDHEEKVLILAGDVNFTFANGRCQNKREYSL